MLDKLTYISSAGRKIFFGEGNIIINTNALRDYEWKYSQSYKRITDFTKDIVSKQLPVLIYGKNTKTIANELFEIVEYDILYKQYGKLYSGDYYMQGYFVASSKPSYTADGFMKLTLTFVTDKPYWIKEINYMYRPDTISQAGLDYNYGYPYDFLPSIGTIDVINPSFAPQNIRIVIYGKDEGGGGAYENPTVLIDSHAYSLNTEIAMNEYVVIDTAEKTIKKISSNGTTTNIFNSRNKESYIFEKIPVGTHTIGVTPSTDVDLIIIEERSEPQWQ